MGLAINGCDTSAFSSSQSPLQIERRQQERQEQDRVGPDTLTSDDIVNNLTAQLGAEASVVQKPDGSIDYHVVQALLESHQTKPLLEHNSLEKQPLTYQEKVKEPSQALGQILNVTA
jgi:hypothetical protein